MTIVRLSRRRFLAVTAVASGALAVGFGRDSLAAARLERETEP